MKITDAYATSRLTELQATKHQATIAVDLDGTLAHYDGYNPEIGKPILKMLRRVKRALKAGHNVIVFTARATDPSEVKKVQAWLKQAGLPALQVTNQKTPNITEIWDDRALNVDKNTGNMKQPSGLKFVGLDPLGERNQDYDTYGNDNGRFVF